ncbi:MAG: hypothetical protein ABIN96_11265 [Rubrivivax sp.]
MPPRQFGPAAGVPTGIVRHPQIGTHGAARRSFMALKLTFLAALEDEPGVDWLRLQVLGAEELGDLWLLRGPVLDALTGCLETQRARRQMLRRGLDSVFPDLDLASGLMPL